MIFLVHLPRFSCENQPFSSIPSLLIPFLTNLNRAFWPLSCQSHFCQRKCELVCSQLKWAFVLAIAFKSLFGLFPLYKLWKPHLWCHREYLSLFLPGRVFVYATLKYWKRIPEVLINVCSSNEMITSRSLFFFFGETLWNGSQCLPVESAPSAAMMCHILMIAVQINSSDHA